MRIALILCAAAAILCDAPAADAYYYAYRQGPWCAVQSLGFGTISRNCNMQTFEQCRMEVIAGNRGTCEPNPYWTAAQAATGKPLKRKRRVR